MTLIDAHHHLWQYNESEYGWMTSAMATLRRDFLPSDMEAIAQELGVAGTVAVQARQTTHETAWLLDLATCDPRLLGVVGWVPLVNPNVADDLDRFAANPKLKGVRHVLQDEPDDIYMLRDDFNRGVAQLRNRNLAYDILILERHLPQTLQFVDRHPSQVFVLDHIAKPRIKENVISPWRENLLELAKRENVYCKISGMVTEADWNLWNIDQLRPYFDAALRAFGPKRLMFGSDWPVLTLAGSYRRWIETFQSLIAGCSPDEQNEICAGTARRAYRL